MISRFDSETAIAPIGEGRWATRLSSNWNIGNHSNGGYALSPVLRAMRTLSEGHPHPLSVTTHFLRPATGDTDATVTASVIRSGRSVTTLTGGLSQQGRQRLVVIAAFGSFPEPAVSDEAVPESLKSDNAVLAVGASEDAVSDEAVPESLKSDNAVLAVGASDDAVPDETASDRSRLEIAKVPPQIPDVEYCLHRSELQQGVELPILSRVDIRVHPDHAPAGQSDRGLMDGWIRMIDDSEPSTLALPFFSDAFPPSLYPLMGFVGWVPTIELTVHVRRLPAPGWLQGRFESHDLSAGRIIESGTLWDCEGRLVAHSRQLGLLLSA